MASRQGAGNPGAFFLPGAMGQRVCMGGASRRAGILAQGLNETLHGPCGYRGAWVARGALGSPGAADVLLAGCRASLTVALAVLRLVDGLGVLTVLTF